MSKVTPKPAARGVETSYAGKYFERLRAYDGLREIPRDVSPANKAVVLIAGICVSSICALATVKAPWYAYGCVIFLSTKYSALAVWREKNAKAKHNDST